MPSDAIEVGRVNGAWGIKGWFKVLPYSAQPEAFFSSKRWFLMFPERGGTVFDDAVKLSIVEAKMHSGTLVASAREIADRGAADALRGARIFIARSSFPTPQDNEYYWVDLIGLSVFNRTGEGLGVVKGLQSTGAQTVLLLEFEKDGSKAQRMIPFVSVYIDAVDLAARRILVDWQLDY